MSEEILKALMQLFAIITKQDDGVSDTEREYVFKFLSQQLNTELVQEYMALYDSFSKTDDTQTTPNDETKKKKLTNVKDSVRTLSICKKINKTLTQKQKVIVLIRLFELVHSDQATSSQKMQIIDTVSTVFNIQNDEFKAIDKFVTDVDLDKTLDVPELLLVGDDFNPETENLKKIHAHGFDGKIAILKVKSVEMYFLKYMGQSDVLLNGLPVNVGQVYLLASGSSIKLPIGDPLYYSDIISKFLSDLEIQKVSFEVKNIHYRFPNGAVGLRGVTFSEGPGKLIGIMGGSGAGKTTLLNVLAGLETPSEGEVIINGFNLHKDRTELEGVIGYVAQDDILFEELTVFQNLYYNAKLCLNHLDEVELQKLVLQILKNLGLGEIRDIKVGNVLNKKISGGQRKRLNIALELIREPSVLFLDEPTSGLSSRDSENVMDLLKELSLKGKLIFVVIHQPSSDIYKMFDKIFILDVGGYPVYYGNSVQAVIYFKTLTNQINSNVGQCVTCGNVNPEQIFNTIDALVVDEYGNLTDKRKISPKEWNEFFHQNIKIESAEVVTDPPPKTLHLPSFLSQFKVFVTREVLNKISNTQYMLINFLEAPVLAFVLAFIIRYIDDHHSGQYSFQDNDNLPAYLFMSIIVALFMGLTVSAEEIIKDAKILKRETFLNLSRSSYLLSKVFILFVLSAIQTLTFVLIGNAILGIKDMTLSYWLMLFSVSCSANLMGLNISSTFNSAVTIYILIPILLIPQMILSGAIFSFDKLNKAVGSLDKVPFIADMMASRWSYEGLAVKQFKDNEFERYFYDMEQRESEADFKQVYWKPYLIDRIDECAEWKDNKDPEVTRKFAKNMTLVKNELEKVRVVYNDLPKKPLADSFFVDLTQQKIDTLKQRVLDVKDYFATKFSEANEEKDQFISRLMKDKKTEKLFLDRKRDYYNQSLADLVKRVDSKKRIIENEGKLIQILDPIFLKPDVTVPVWDYRTHFYSPQKRWMGNAFDTYYFNLTVIWIMTIILYVMLYFDVLKKMISMLSLMEFKRKIKP